MLWDYLHLGIPKDAIALERLASNASENSWLSAELLRDLATTPQTSLIVTKPYAARRRWPGRQAAVTSEQVSLDDYRAGPVPASQILSRRYSQRRPRPPESRLQQPIPDIIPAAAFIPSSRSCRSGTTCHCWDWIPVISTNSSRDTIGVAPYRLPRVEFDVFSSTAMAEHHARLDDVGIRVRTAEPLAERKQVWMVRGSGSRQHESVVP